MARDVKVTLNLAKAATGSGFGYPLIFEGKATKAIAYTECATIDEVIRVVGGITDEDDASAVETKTAAAKATNLYKAALLLLMQDKAPEKIAVCATTAVATTGLASILHLGWRQLIVTSVGTEGEDSRKVISDYIETTGSKMYFASVGDISELEGDAAISGNDRTVLMVHEDDVASVVFPEAALVGATAGKPAGSFTYKNQILKGLTPKVMTRAEIDAVHKVNAMAFVLKSGDGVTSEGKATSDEYIDIIDSQDYIIQNIEHDTQKLLNSVDKVPYDNTGIAMLENVCVNVLKNASNNGMIAVTEDGKPNYSVSYKLRSDTNAADRAVRRYIGGSFYFALAGVVHEVEVVGTIEI